MKLEKDISDFRIQGFAPNVGVVLSGTVVVKSTTVVKLGKDVNISINGVSVQYLAGEGLILVPSVSYIFDTSVNCHIMS